MENIVADHINASKSQNVKPIGPTDPKGNCYICKPRAGDLDVPRARLTRTQKGPLHAGLRVYNDLPEAVRLLPEKAFKRTLKRSLIVAAPYSFRESPLEF